VEECVPRIVEMNGEPGVLGYLDGKPFSVITLEGGEGGDGAIIRAIYLVTNPES
jgi:RNA polymerase sigma-70 factor (ECF subfamily)